MRNKKILELSLIVGGLLLSIFIIPIMIGFLSTNNIDSDEKNNDKKMLKEVVDLKEVNVYITQENKVETLSLEDYVVSVVSSEMPASFHEEALKAQAVLVRTYAINKMIRGCSNIEKGDICDTVHCQVYTNIDKKMKAWGENGEGYLKKIKKAVEDTKGEILSYNNEIIKYPQYFSTSSGKTEEAVYVFSEDVPYLKSVESKGEEISPKYKSELTLTKEDFISKINENIKDININGNLEKEIKILGQNPGGTVDKIRIGNTEIKGTEFRRIFSLNSANFTIEFSDKEVIINCLGYGHGVGMSQWGANVMGKNGESYEKILEHYFTGTKVKDNKKVFMYN